MPKAEKGTPKDIANRAKAKGLQKLKFYCQMCQKQCRDQNGFKCHLTSESHLRQMKIFSGNARGIVDNMSKEFETSYMETLRRRHGTKRVNANNVYQEVIQDKHHIHMNATKWATLTDFMQYIGKMGKCVVEETERGWYVQYIERDAGILARMEAQQRRVEAEKASEQRLAKQMEIQRVEAAKALDRAGGTLHTEATTLDRSTDDAAITMTLGKAAKKKASVSRLAIKSVLDIEDEDEAESDEERLPSVADSMPSKHGASIVDLSKKQGSKGNAKRDTHIEGTGSRKRARQETRNDYRSASWLFRDILVRIISKDLAGGRYYKRKAVVDRVLEDTFTAEVQVLDSGPNERDGGDVLRLDQDDLETVVPKEGKSVRIVNGQERGKRAIVMSLDKKKYRAILKLSDDTILERVDYGDLSKLA